MIKKYSNWNMLLIILILTLYIYLDFQVYVWKDFVKLFVQK